MVNTPNIRLARILSATLCLAAMFLRCSHPRVGGETAAIGSGERMPFRYITGHIIRVPVKVVDTLDTIFVLDTGIGVNLVSKSLAEKLSLKALSSFSGKRMSGQSVQIPMSKIHSLAFGRIRLEDVPVGLFDMSGFPPEMKGVEGILSLRFFEAYPFTYDYPNQQIVIENERTLGRRVNEGVVVPVRLVRDGPSLGILMPLGLPNGETIEVEVDTGSGSLILDARYMSRLAIQGGLAGLRRVDGKDETNYSYTRYFGKLDGISHAGNAVEIAQKDSPVQFQKIIYDGLVGDAFLKNFRVTYDLPRSRIIFSKP